MDRINEKISFIVPLYYGNRYVPSILRLVKRNMDFIPLKERPYYEVIFVNDSPDELVRIHDLFDFDVFVINNPQNYGIHKSRIIGLNHAKGDYIIFFDQDDDAKESWVFSLWHKIIKEGATMTVCNAWVNRLTVGLREEDFIERINALDSYIELGNPIITPGQVIMKRNTIPQEWLNNVVAHNGSDDYYLWVILLKKGCHFNVVNTPFLYHNPTRTEHSVIPSEMKESGKEVVNLLLDGGIINLEEAEQVRKRIQNNSGVIRRASIINDWERREQEGNGIIKWLFQKGIRQVAIYGTGELGLRLFEQLQESPIEISYCIDKRGKDYKNEITCYTEPKELPYTDLIIDTTSGLPKETVNQIKEQGLKMISLQSILSEE